jgi:hypothetical protein
MTFESKGSARSKILTNYRNIHSVKILQYVGSDLPLNLNDLHFFCGVTAQLELRLLRC